MGGTTPGSGEEGASGATTASGATPARDAEAGTAVALPIEEPGRCPLCGTRHRRDDIVCDGCGTNLLTGEPPRVERFGKRRFNARWAIIFTLAAVSIGGGYMLYMYRRGKQDERYVTEGRDDLRRGDRQAAEESFRRALSYEEKNVDAWNGLAEAILADPSPARAKEAEEAAAKALELQKDSAEAHLLRGRARYVRAQALGAGSGSGGGGAGGDTELQAERQKLLAGALAALKDAERERSSLPQLRYFLGHVHFLRGEPAAALTSYAEALRRVPGAPEAALGWLRTGVIYLEMGRLDDAEKALQSALAKKAPDAEVREALGEVYAKGVKAGDAARFARARAEYEAARRLDDKRPSLFFKMAQLEWRAGDRELALRHLTRAKEAAGSSIPAAFFKVEGQIHAEQKDPEKAFAAFREAAKRAPRDPSIFDLLGVLRMEQGELGRAEEEFETALSLRQTYTPALVHLAELHLKREDPRGAAGYFRKAAELEPGNADLHVQLGRALVAAKDPVRAIEAFEAAVGANPALEEPYERLADLFLEVGKARDAAAALEDLLRIRKGDPPTRVKLARIYINECRLDDALSLLKDFPADHPIANEARALTDEANTKKLFEERPPAGGR